jgi:hypothetical protein
MSPKKRWNDFLCVEILDIGYTNSIRIDKIFLRQKEGYDKYYFYIYILTYTKLYYLSSMDLKGSYLFWFLLNEPTNYLMSGNSYFNNKNPTSAIPTSLHGYFQKLDKDSKHNRWMWFYTLHNIPLFPKSLELPLSNRYSLLRMTTLHTHIKTPKLSKMMLRQQPLLKSLTHSSFLLCWSLKWKC